ncbi:MAG: hypothetical protein NZ937_06530 [Armatimonadetes bacterium]|nr:hypothetical protein [Armatimonadota bacterium]
MMRQQIHLLASFNHKIVAIGFCPSSPPIWENFSYDTREPKTSQKNVDRDGDWEQISK